MNARADAVAASPPVDTPEIVPLFPPTRPLYWSVRRELWENRSIYLAPLAVAAILMFGFLVSTITLPEKVRQLPELELTKQYERVMMPFHAAAGIPFVAALLVGAFYCLDALYGERRDRSILFWKSLPVSDRTTVLAKASIPLIVLPLIVYALIVVTQLILLAASAAVLAANGVDLALWWSRLPLFQTALAVMYALAIAALWHAPLYAWLLLVSAWARRAPILWAALPPLGIAMFEAVALRTSLFGALLEYRVVGWFTEGFLLHGEGTVPSQPLTHLSPGRFLALPGLWLGLVFAAACLALAVRLRRSREPT